MEPPPGHQTVEVVATLLVSGGTEGESSDGTSCNGVIMFFMSLDVLSKLDPTVFVVVDAKTSDDVARAESFGYAVLVGKSIQPEDAEENHFGDHFGRKMVKRSNVVRTSSTFLHRANASQMLSSD